MDVIDLLVKHHKPTESKVVPGVYIRVMRGAERAAWDEYARQAKDDAASASENYARLLSFVLCDEQGERVLADNAIDELNRRVDYRTLEALAIEALRVNGASDEAIDAAKKDSASNQNSDSGSSSPAPSA